MSTLTVQLSRQECQRVVQRKYPFLLQITCVVATTQSECSATEFNDPSCYPPSIGEGGFNFVAGFAVDLPSYYPLMMLTS